MKKYIVFLMLLLSMSMVVPAIAAPDDVRTGTASGGETAGEADSPSGNSSIQGAVDGVINEFAPAVSADDIVGRLENKGNDVVHILQTAGRYVCIGAFIICCLLTLFGVMGNTRLLWAGVIGMVIAGLAYAGIVCGREIVNWIANWAIS